MLAQYLKERYYTSIVKYIPHWYLYLFYLAPILGVLFIAFPTAAVLFSVCAVGVLFLSFMYFSRLQQSTACIFFLGICILGIGALIHAHKVQVLYYEHIYKATSALPEVVGTVEDVFEDSVQNHVYDIRTTAGVRVRATTTLFTHFLPGDIVSISLFRVVDTSSLYASYYKAKNIHAVARYAHVEKIGQDFSFISKTRRQLYLTREQMIKKIQTISRPPHSELLEGLLLGSRTLTTGNYKDILQKNGVLHIVALSGFNLMLIVGVMSRFFRKKSVWFYGAIFLCAFLFSLVVGMPSSLLRALVALGIVYLLRAQGRFENGRTALLVCISIVALFSPYTFLYDGSFHLSCIALFAILCIAPHVSVLLEKYIKNEYLRDLCATSLSAWLCTMPYLFFVFDQALQIRGVLINILVVPLVAPVTILGGISLGLATIFPFLKSFIFYAVSYAIEPLLRIVLLY